MSDSYGGQNEVDDSELYDKSAEELQWTLENILTSHHEISQRAIDLVKINILALSVIVTGISLSGLNVGLSLVAGFVAFLYSTWSCIQVYHPRQFIRGLNQKDGIKIDKMIKDGTGGAEINRKLLYSYGESISDAREAHKFENLRFRNGLWASIAAILFFSIAGFIHVFGGIPLGFEVPILFIIPILVLWGKNNTAEYQ